ncbi:nitroreductase [Segniliparus rotundus DSM 44985]|uniref:Nitroreductase n=1 Tax=Segniliparus rotundus (strain ATCC BAA-972 / CDC 1076 / CIP 108378 / DSM 44985 / JCM 13578) TaxID=640132 RepID=D6Z7S6_SEGRD|nr:nitroreductase family protein [Segniliparus rotundus]ADG98006.1 nitroreductase [Segniliparus rotundus DSM 44985]
MTRSDSSDLPDTGPIDWVLSTTRSVRKRLDFDRPVPKEIVLEALRLAVQAPTGSNAQGWQWVVVEDQAKKNAIAELYRTAWASYAGNAKPDEIPGQQGRVVGSAQYLAENLQRAPLFVIPTIKADVPVRDMPDGALAGFYGSIIPAAWSFLLALRSRGLGSAWTTLHLLHEAQTRQILGIPDDFVQVALLPVAYTIGTDFKPAQRAKPVEAITHWDSWGATLA